MVSPSLLPLSRHHNHISHHHQTSIDATTNMVIPTTTMRHMSFVSKMKKLMKELVTESVRKTRQEKQQLEEEEEKAAETLQNKKRSKKKSLSLKKSTKLSKTFKSTPPVNNEMDHDFQDEDEETNIDVDDENENENEFMSTMNEKKRSTSAAAISLLTRSPTSSSTSSPPTSSKHQKSTSVTDNHDAEKSMMMTNNDDMNVANVEGANVENVENVDNDDTSDEQHLFNIINPSKYTNVQHFMDLLSDEERKQYMSGSGNGGSGETLQNHYSLSTKKVISPRHSKFLRISVLGNPNVGKSSLLNKVTHAKVSAVSPKKQTTREQLTVVHNVREAQLVFTDTPGVISPRYKKSDVNVSVMTDPLMREAMSSLDDTDVVLLMIDVTKPLEEIDHLIKAIAHHHATVQQQNATAAANANAKSSTTPVVQPKRFKCIAVLNKKDLLEEDDNVITDLEYALLETKVFVDVIPMSVHKNEGIDRLKRVLFEMSYEHPWKYNVVLPQLTLKQRLSEIVREKLYQRINKEIPYNVELFVARVELTRPVPDGVIVDIDLRCKTIGQRKIVIGALPFIHKHSLKDMYDLFKTTKVHLSFEVSVVPGKEGLSKLSQDERKERLKLLSAYSRESYHRTRAQEKKQKQLEGESPKAKRSQRRADIWTSH